MLINTVKDAPPLPAGNPTVTTNGFLVEYLGNKYIVTSAHTFFTEAQTPSIANDEQSGRIQSTITVEINDTLYYFSSDEVVYSRSLDIAFVPVFTTSKALSLNFANGKLAETCFVSYTDILTRTNQIVEGKYVPFIQGQVDMFAITNTTSNGTSGTPVFNSKGQILGMVSALSGAEGVYSNMTLCVPSNTILTMLTRYNNNVVDNNLDNLNLFADMFVNSIEPIVSMYVNSNDGILRNILKTAGGQRLIYTDKDSGMYPWDILTKVTTNNKEYKIGSNAYSLNRVLLENLGNEENLNVEIYRIQDYYFKRFFQIPKTIYCNRNEEGFFYQYRK